MLHIIGLGLNDEKDISLKGLEAVKNSDFVYLEDYTSILNCRIKDLENLYGKEIIKADRNLVETSEEIIDNSKDKNVAFLVIGDPLSATTHIELFLEAKKRNIETEIIPNASILSSVGITGLQIYKFGKTTSIPLENKDVTAPYDVLADNQKLGLHTLFLLDLNPDKKEFLNVKEAINYLLRVEKEKKGNVFTEDTVCIACSQIGSKKPEIKAGKAKELLKLDFKKLPQSLIVPGKLHFKEEEALEFWR